MTELRTFDLPDISQAVPLTDADKDLVRDLRNVLEKHDALKRFA